MFQDQSSQSEDVYEHFGIKPSHIDFTNEAWETSSVNSESAEPTRHDNDCQGPTQRCRRGAVVGGYKDMAVVHEHHK